jgi:pilus assembly protein CpaE
MTETGKPLVMEVTNRDQESLSMSTLSVVLIAPDFARRLRITKALAGPQAGVTREFVDYPDIDDLLPAVEDCDVVILELDSDAERALDLVESICSRNSSTTVMVYSLRNEPDLLVRCMRVGAREFLVEPVAPAIMAEALVRASSRRQEFHRQKRATGKLLVFCGVKGGSGVTTLATNFAVALTKESAAKVVLVDLDLQLGDVALELGLTPKFSVVDALKGGGRLDSAFMSTLIAKHSSGLSVLAGPDNYDSFVSPNDGAKKIMNILRNDFEYVVVDAGPGLDTFREPLLEMADCVYLVSEVTIPALRNSHRLISKLLDSFDERKLQIVLNRYDPRVVEIDENSINKALTRPAKWKLPNDYSAVRRAQNTGVPVVMENTPLSRVLFEMARAACGKVAVPEKKKKFSLFG